MTDSDFQYALRKMGFVDMNKAILRNGDCRIAMYNSDVSIADGVEKLLNYPICRIQRITLDTLANMLIVLIGGDKEYGFIL
jgi:hypothetical protein